MNFFPFAILHYDGKPFAVRIKNIIRFENREIVVNNEGKPCWERVDETFEEIENLIRKACEFPIGSIISEIDGE